MKKHLIRIVLSLALVISMLLTAMPAALADDIVTEMSDMQAMMAGIKSTEEVYGVLDPDTVPEIVGYENAKTKSHVKRLYEQEGDDLYKIIFLNADGTQTAYLYDYPVKYVDDNGTIKDITLDITANDVSGGFSSADTNAVAAFPQNVSDGISLRGNGTSVSLVPMIPLTADVQSGLSANAVQSTVMQIDDKTVAYQYDTNTSIQYSLTYTGFKENIIVDEYTGRTSYDFTLYTNGLELICDESEYCLADGDGDVKATLGDIIIFTADEANNTMGSMTARTVRQNQQYIITVSVDPEWLSDPKTVYPICIDPTVEINYDDNGAGAISDITLNSNTDSNPTSGTLSVGLRETYGISRILMKFPGLDLDAIGNNVSVTDASVEIRDLLSGVGDSLEVSCYVFAGNEWDESTAEWANVDPNKISTFLSSNMISYAEGKKQPTSHRYSYDITKAVQGWIDGNYNPEKGIIFKGPDSVEDGDDYNYRTIASYNRSSYKPSLSITYSTTNNLVSNDTYYLNNRYYGDYVRYYSSSPTVSSGLLSTLGNSIQWDIVAVNGGYAIRAKSDTTKYLGVSASTANTYVFAVTVRDSEIPERCIWDIKIATGGGCIIKSKYNSKYLFTNGVSVYTSSTLGTTGTSTYDSRVWRIASTTYYGNTTSNSARELRAGFNINQMILDVGATRTPVINKYPTNAVWSNASDFTYSFSSGTSGSVTFDLQSGKATANAVGISSYTATHKVTGRTYTFTIYVDRYTYELVNLFGFDSDVSLLIRNIYNKINDVYSSNTEEYKAWVASRLLSEFCYDNSTTYFGIIQINKWDDVAGTITSPSNRKSYFIDTFGYSEAEYNILDSALVAQHSNSKTSDFAHMQYSLAARLAYKLDQDGVLSNIYTISGDEYVSYLGGWLGDATLPNGDATSFGNDDYMADLDAENVFRDIDNGEDSITAINAYYKLLNGSSTRATIFKGYISYSTVESMVLSKLGKTLNQVRSEYPDTYDFLMSLKDGLAEINHY